MTIAEAIRELEVLAETGQVPSELVAVVKNGLTLHESRHERRAKHAMIVNRLTRLEVGPLDVLVLRLPDEVINDEASMRQLQVAASEIADVAKRGVVLLHEDAPLTVEALPEQLQALLKPKIVTPGPGLILPPHLQRGT